MGKILFFLLCLSRFVGVVSSLLYVGPDLDFGQGAQSSGAGYYMLDGVTLPSGTIMRLEFFVDRSISWSPFTLTIFRPIGDSSTTTQYRIVGIYPITAQPSVETGITGQNFNSADYIVVSAGDHLAFYNSLQAVSITAQFNGTASLSTRFSVPSNPVPAVGETITIDRVGLGPTFYSLRVMMDESNNAVTTCQGGGFSVCNQLCTDDVTGYYCSCDALYQLDPTDNATCVAIPRTCVNDGNNFCDHNCTDTGVGYVCLCMPGFTLQSNGYSCVDDDSSAVVGEQGRTGVKGERGLQGQMGQQGIAGTTGPTGPQGSTGVQGTQGATGLAGSVGPKGSTGANGTQGDVGDQGANGEKGSVGPVGFTGPIGPIGLVGATGLPGINGLNGVAGQKGERGDTGATGQSGSNGGQGIQGAEGKTGETGPMGNTGPKGDQGFMGMVGLTGPMGATGQQGPIYQETDECQTNHMCEQNCVNTIGGYYCTCNAGYTLRAADNMTCAESQECLVQNGNCQQTCTERTGGYVCSCIGGYDLGPDRHSCIDRNECSNSTLGGCISNEMCVNTPGSSMCVPSSPDTAAVLACSKAESLRVNECQYSNGLVSGNTVIGFIVWLILLTILVLGILGCVLCINNNRRRYSKGYDRRSDYWEDKSGTAPTRFSSIRTRLPESNYTYY
ncbi:fibrillin-2-like [Mizuhopecten yessoensis]|uniref:Collagen alpha-5(VI) chain n=1 Tax=Mizuhopecten yessoensis TaxID=6573 RepID=A0A210Q6Y7_MIZYE|nr:fibrillin-2-like [Mizuhopecten yessoensis]OWF44494.1 Collagen alpha-5(VI) chain [Mizuhopecten yessoensis]